MLGTLSRSRRAKSSDAKWSNPAQPFATPGHQRRNYVLKAALLRVPTAYSLVKGFWSGRLAGAEPWPVRIMSMRARNVAGTCRCPG
jgi:hypothetical protein